MLAPSQSSVISPTILVLTLLAGGVVWIGATGLPVPLLTNPRVAILVLVVLGMAICSQGGIGRVAAAGQWSHPLAIVGYILGALILIVAVAGLAGWALPLVRSGPHALAAIAVLMMAKFAVAFIHAFFLRS